MLFRIGDKVRYELSAFMMPRWFGGRDYGGSGTWEEGTVVSVYNDKVAVRGKCGLTIWPLVGHCEYNEVQWERPGFLRLVERAEAPSERKCVCGAHAVYGKDCQLHSSWCDLPA